MGRHKQFVSARAQANQKASWVATSNKKRKSRYATDPEYREKVKARSRDHYREKHEVSLRPLDFCKKRLEDMGRMRKIVLAGANVTALTFSVKELANALGGINPIVIYRWHADKLFPRPNVIQQGAQEDDDGAHVYTLGQMKRLIAVMEEHQKKSLYLRKSDRATIKAFFAQVKSAL